MADHHRVRPVLERSLRALLPVGGALAAASLGVAAFTAYRLNGPTRRRWIEGYTFTPWELQVPYETVSFRADDGVTIRGWWMPRADSTAVVVGCSGHRGAKHELLGIGSCLWRAGNNLLLFDFRGRGESDLAACSLAYHELVDLRAAVEWTCGRVPNARLGIVGYSMGAAVSILGAAREPRIAAVVADSPFATMRDVIRHGFRRRGLPAWGLVDLAAAVNRLQYGYAYHAVQPIEMVAAIAPRPLLLIHGDRDSVIPVEHSMELYAAAGEPKELWIVPDAEHCGGYFVDRQHYTERVVAFFRQALEDGGNP